MTLDWRAPVVDRGWKRPFDDPIPLPRGRQLVILKDAAMHIQKLFRPIAVNLHH
jgi:hypothetical protein